MIDFEPDDEQALIVETVRQFAENEIRPKARPCDEAREIDVDLLARAHELGLVANGLPEEHGGGGERSAVTGCLIAEELAWGDLSLGLAILCPNLLGLPLADHGSAAQQQRWLPALTGPSFAPGSLAIVEPRFDFDPLQPHTTAKRAGGDVVLDGVKCFVPWLEGDAPVLVVAGDEGRPALFAVERDARGLHIERERNMGLQALPTAELHFASVRVPPEARIGEGRACDLAALVARGRVALAAMAVGVGRAAYEIARDYAKEREAFGAPIATKQAIAFKLADMITELDGARLLAWEAAALLDAGRPAGREAVLAIDKARRTVLAVADGAVQVLGGHGYTREYLPEMHLRNARGFASFEALALV